MAYEAYDGSKGLFSRKLICCAGGLEWHGCVLSLTPFDEPAACKENNITQQHYIYINWQEMATT